jgi:hypothetical protein
MKKESNTQNDIFYKSLDIRYADDNENKKTIKQNYIIYNIIKSILMKYNNSKLIGSIPINSFCSLPVDTTESTILIKDKNYEQVYNNYLSNLIVSASNHCKINNLIYSIYVYNEKRHSRIKNSICVGLSIIIFNNSEEQKHFEQTNNIYIHSSYDKFEFTLNHDKVPVNTSFISFMYENFKNTVKGIKTINLIISKSDNIKDLYIPTLEGCLYYYYNRISNSIDLSFHISYDDLYYYEKQDIDKKNIIEILLSYKIPSIDICTIPDVINRIKEYLGDLYIILSLYKNIILDDINSTNHTFDVIHRNHHSCNNLDSENSFIHYAAISRGYINDMAKKNLLMKNNNSNTLFICKKYNKEKCGNHNFKGCIFYYDYIKG